MHRLILLLALIIALPLPTWAQAADSLTGADRAAIAGQVLRARHAELRDRVPVDREALERVLGSARAVESALATLPEAECGAPRQQGRWRMEAMELGADGDVLVRADRVEGGGAARTETYRLRRTCSPAGTCAWWLVDVRLSGFESNDEVPLPARP